MFYISSAVIRTRHTLFLLILNYPYKEDTIIVPTYTDEETGIQRDWVACSE